MKRMIKEDEQQENTMKKQKEVRRKKKELTKRSSFYLTRKRKSRSHQVQDSNLCNRIPAQAPRKHNCVRRREPEVSVRRLNDLGHLDESVKGVENRRIINSSNAAARPRTFELDFCLA